MVIVMMSGQRHSTPSIHSPSFWANRRIWHHYLHRTPPFLLPIPSVFLFLFFLAPKIKPKKVEEKKKKRACPQVLMISILCLVSPFMKPFHHVGITWESTDKIEADGWGKVWLACLGSLSWVCEMKTVHASSPSSYTGPSEFVVLYLSWAVHRIHLFWLGLFITLCMARLILDLSVTRNIYQRIWEGKGWRENKGMKDNWV